MTSRMTVHRQTRNRRDADSSVPPRRFPATISSVSLESANTIRITFETSVIPSKVPGYTAGAETVSSMSRISDTEVDFTFSGSVAGATLVVPDSDPGVRTQTGGFVPAGNYAIPLT